MLADKLTGLGINEDHIHQAVRELKLDITKPSRWTDEELINFSANIRKQSKPMLIAFNKCDIAKEEFMSKSEILKKQGYIVVPTSAESELALSNAAKKAL